MPKETKKEEVPALTSVPESKKPEFRNPYVPQFPLEELTAMDVDNEEPTHAALQRKEPSKPTKIIKKKVLLDETELEDAADAQGNLDPENLFSHVGILHDSTWKSSAVNSEPLIVPLSAVSCPARHTTSLIPAHYCRAVLLSSPPDTRLRTSLQSIAIVPRVVIPTTTTTNTTNTTTTSTTTNVSTTTTALHAALGADQEGEVVGA